MEKFTSADMMIAFGVGVTATAIGSLWGVRLALLFVGLAFIAMGLMRARAE